MRFLPAVLLLLIPGTAAAQATSTYPPIQLPFRETGTYFNPTATQLQSLKTVQSAKNEAQDELHNLRKQLTAPFEPYYSRALAILNQDQQSKLANLANALQLSSAASQAAMLSLIAPLPPPRTGGPLPFQASESDPLHNAFSK
jgi:hypothetical protein